MRIALIGPPFIEIPPRRYGGTELFIAQPGSRARARAATTSIVYANGDSRAAVPSGGATRTASGR